MMKLQRAASVLALLAFAADAGSVSRLLQEEGEAAAEDTGEAATADETGETTGETGEAETETAEGETGETETAEGEECAEGDENCPAEEGTEAEEEPEEEKEKFEPGGNPTKPYQYIFSQGAWNWEGETIIAPFTKNQIATASAGDEIKNQDEDIVMRVDDKINIEVGRIDGQTGWTGVNQAGSKTMSYQIAIII